MEVAELMLAFVKELAWPIVVGGAVFAFRRQIAAKIGALKEATTPIGGASFFDREAGEVSRQATEAAERQLAADRSPSTTPPKPIPAPPSEDPAGGASPRDGELAESRPISPSSGSTEPPATDNAESAPEAGEDPEVRKKVDAAVDRRMDRLQLYNALASAVPYLTAPPDFSVAKEIATTSPQAAVMLAYSDVEKVARSAWIVAHQEEPKRFLNMRTIVRDLNELSLDDAFVELAADITSLRNAVSHGMAESEVSISGALNFIDACESLSTAMTHLAMSMMRHPSRSKEMLDWVAWIQQEQSNPARSYTIP